MGCLGPPRGQGQSQGPTTETSGRKGRVTLGGGDENIRGRWRASQPLGAMTRPFTGRAPVCAAGAMGLRPLLPVFASNYVYSFICTTHSCRWKSRDRRLPGRAHGHMPHAHRAPAWTHKRAHRNAAGLQTPRCTIQTPKHIRNISVLTQTRRHVDSRPERRTLGHNCTSTHVVGAVTRSITDGEREGT